ncbi:hypothetical protein [Streptomyces acidiscabies]|uniref:Uncharacterized protein n=1 Tax=Streptomyces acidiscabies TaxID=42234 RepID=A0ABU4MCT3_9ACTN|nr:hypothetical protein [Streptomyces acidiscabies]MDX3025622.1 hypothetical protein [Streptomyces acidiscabies]
MFTQKERGDLAAGRTVQGECFVSAKTETFDAAVAWREEGGKKKIVFSFT